MRKFNSKSVKSKLCVYFLIELVILSCMTKNLLHIDDIFCQHKIMRVERMILFLFNNSTCAFKDHAKSLSSEIYCIGILLVGGSWC